MSREIRYRPDIDGLRAVAVLSVLAYHISPERVRGGFIGVDVFFVISGYLISSILYREIESGVFSVRDFYIRRIRRLYPALFLVLVATALAGWFLLLPSAFIALAKQITAGSLFVANFALWWHSGYFSPDAAYIPLLHLWSLGVEEQFYFVFPLICILFFRRRSRFGMGSAILVIGLISMVINVALVRNDAPAAYFLPFSRFWELFIGAGLSLLVGPNGDLARWGKWNRNWLNAIAACGLLAILGAAFELNESDRFPGWWGLLPTIGAAAIIISGSGTWTNRRILSTKPVVFIGLISYPLYLWHWPILSFVRIAKKTWGIEMPYFERGVLVVGGSFLLAYLTYRFVEKPIRAEKEPRRRQKSAVLLLCCVLATGAVGVLLISLGGVPGRYPSRVVALDHDYASDGSTAWREGTCFLRPDQDAHAFSDGCVDPPESGASGSVVLVWGDSHAADLLPGLHALLASRTNVRLAQFTASLCAPILNLDLSYRPMCRAINDAVLQRVRTLKPDAVILSAFWDYPDPEHSAALKAEMLLRSIQEIQAAGVRNVAIIGSVPYWSNDVPTLLINEVLHNASAPVAERLPKRFLLQHDDELLRSIAARSGAAYVPIYESLCNVTGCLATTGPTWRDVLTYDTAHFTVHGSTAVAPLIWNAITSSMNSSQEESKLHAGHSIGLSD